jgi:hypothetical protein
MMSAGRPCLSLPHMYTGRAASSAGAGGLSKARLCEEQPALLAMALLTMALLAGSTCLLYLLWLYLPALLACSTCLGAASLGLEPSVAYEVGLG